MRLAYVAKMFPRISETFVLSEIQALRRAGVPLIVYSLLPPNRDAKVHPEAEALSGETVLLPQPSWEETPRFFVRLQRCARVAPLRTIREVARALLTPTPRSFRMLFRAVALADRLRRDEISHVHAAWAHTPASVSEIASRLTRIPWSMAAHAKDIHTSDPRSLARKMSSARFTLACTAHHRDVLCSIAERWAGRFPPGEVRLAYHGVDAGRFAPREPGPPAGARPPMVLFVGRLVPKKGADVLLEAAALLRARGIEFAIQIVGEGPQRPAIERRVEELGLRDVVSLEGLLVRDEVRERMLRAACFALPCRVTPEGDRDGIPNSLAEAMASGLAVVSTRLPSIEELVEDQRSGLLVPPEDPESLADALSQVLLDEELRRRLGAHARVIACGRFDARRCEPERVRHLSRAVGIARALYVSGDRGVPVRGGKGASIHVRALIQAWRDLGVESLLVTANGGPTGGPEPGAEVREAPAGPFLTKAAAVVARFLGGGPGTERACLRLLHNLTLYREAARAAARWRPDVVYERYALCSIAGGLLARRLGVPHILEVNAPLADEEARYRGLGLARITRWLERWTMRRADHVVVVSPTLDAHARRQGVRSDRIRVLPNGVDTRLFHPARDGEAVRERLGLDGEFVAGFSGSLRPWHGVSHLIAGFAAASNAHPAMRLLILGDGQERASLEALARERGVAERVVFTGAVPHAEVGDYLAACDVLCAPYGPSEEFYFSPIKIAEYFASGRPVVASDVGRLREALGEASSAAVWTAPGDEAGIGDALVALARDPERRDRLSRNAASSVWTWSDVARATLSVAERVRERLWAWRPVTVGYVVKMFPRFSETFILNEILEMERAGVRVVIFSMKSPAETIRQPGVERVRAPVVVLSERAAARAPLVLAHAACALRAPSRYVRTAAFVGARRNESARTKFLHAAILAVEARNRGVSHLHAHFASGPARQAKFVSMLSGIPYSFTAHAKDLYWNGQGHGTAKKLKRRIQRASFVVTISDHNRRFLEGLDARVPPERIVTIYNGLDLEAWPLLRPTGRPARAEEAPLILAVGRLVEKKGFHVLLDSLGILRSRGHRFRCLIAGEGPERDRLLAMIEQRGLEPVARILGPVTQDRLVSELYPKAHVLAQPSVVAADGDQDGIPTVILEAMATGVPVVATPVSGIEEAVVHLETGLIVPPGDAPALADALLRVLADDALAARLATGARRLIEERFSLRENATHLRRRLMEVAL